MGDFPWLLTRYDYDVRSAGNVATATSLAVYFGEHLVKPVDFGQFRQVVDRFVKD